MRRHAAELRLRYFIEPPSQDRESEGSASHYSARKMNRAIPQKEGRRRTMAADQMPPWSPADLWPPEDTVDCEEFSVGELLGSGGFGRVHRALSKSGCEVAIKVLPPSESCMEMAKEIELLRSCRSSHIVSYVGAALHASGQLWILMECCEGSVLDIMTATQMCLSERQISAVVAAVLDGLLFLHRRNIMHRDVKCGNILCTRNGGIKLADFGVATRLSSSFSARHTLVGTAPWLAPEVVVGTSSLLARQAGLPAGCGYGKKADVWSLGITVIEMGDGQPPLGGASPHAALFFIPSQPAPTMAEPSRWSPSMRSFLARALVKAPQERASVGELLLEGFVAEFGRSNQQSGELHRLIYAALPMLSKMRRELAQRQRERAAEAERRRHAQRLHEQQQAAVQRRDYEQGAFSGGAGSGGDGGSGSDSSVVIHGTTVFHSHASGAESHLGSRLGPQTQHNIRDLAAQILAEGWEGAGGSGDGEDTSPPLHADAPAPALAAAGGYVLVQSDSPTVAPATADDALGVGSAVTPEWAEVAASLVLGPAAAPAPPNIGVSLNASGRDGSWGGRGGGGGGGGGGSGGGSVSSPPAVAFAPSSSDVEIAAGPHSQHGTLVVHESRSPSKPPTFLRKLQQMIKLGPAGASGSSTGSTGGGAGGGGGGRGSGGRGRNQRGRGQQQPARSMEAIAAERAALEKDRLRELERVQRNFSKREEELAKEEAAMEAALAAKAAASPPAALAARAAGGANDVNVAGGGAPVVPLH